MSKEKIIDASKYPTRGKPYPYADYKGTKYHIDHESYNPEMDDNMVLYQILNADDKALALATALVGLKRTNSPRGAAQETARVHHVCISGWVIRKHLYPIIGREVKKYCKRRRMQEVNNEW